MAQLKISVLCLAAETQNIEPQPGFNLADTYIISRGQLRFQHLSSSWKQTLKVPINEPYKQITKMSAAEKGKYTTASNYTLF